jgi:hypothetical protein
MDGTVTCEVDDDTTYSAGPGLTLTGTTFAVNTSTIQARVTGTCPAGQAIRAIAMDGTVTCEVDDDTTYSAGPGLTLTGTTFAVAPGQSSDTAAASCRALRTAMPSAGDGYYWIDPDGPAGLRPFQVWCDMTNGGWVRVQQTSFYPFAIHTEGPRRQGFTYELTDAQINAIRAISTEATQNWSCQGLGIGGPYDLVGWDGASFTVSSSGVCWHSDNASYVSGSGTHSLFARLPLRAWTSADCGDVTEACQYNVGPAFFR